MKCPNCRAKVPKEYQYCPRCGLSVKTARESGKNANIILTAMICFALIGGGYVALRELKKPVKHTAEKPVAESTAPPVTKAPEPETTAPESTAAAETTTAAKTTPAPEPEKTEPPAVKTPETTKAPESAPNTETTAKPADAKPAGDGTSASDYYKTLGAMPFHSYDGGDVFLPPGLYTRSDNTDGLALSEADAKNAMMRLGIDWGKNADLYCGDAPDDGGSSNSTYRYIADAFPVPGYSDLQLPAAVDLYIHNGDAAQGSYLRAVDYWFGNHDDYKGKYIWTKAEIEKIFDEFTKFADGVCGGHTVVNDNNLAHYDFYDGALSAGYYERGGRYVFWISRAND